MFHYVSSMTISPKGSSRLEDPFGDIIIDDSSPDSCEVAILHKATTVVKHHENLELKRIDFLLMDVLSNI